MFSRILEISSTYNGCRWIYRKTQRTWALYFHCGQYEKLRTRIATKPQSSRGRCQLWSCCSRMRRCGPTYSFDSSNGMLFSTTMMEKTNGFHERKTRRAPSLRKYDSSHQPHRFKQEVINNSLFPALGFELDSLFVFNYICCSV
jgi:hypothetical protein